MNTRFDDVADDLRTAYAGRVGWRESTDFTAEMVAACAAKGLEARVMDVLAPDLPPESFDAAYSLNCLLHVPNADLPTALASVRTLLRPGGLFFLGVYGGDGSEGVHENDRRDPPRFFSWRTDEQLLAFTGEQLRGRRLPCARRRRLPVPVADAAPMILTLPRRTSAQRGLGRVRSRRTRRPPGQGGAAVSPDRGVGYPPALRASRTARHSTRPSARPAT